MKTLFGLLLSIVISAGVFVLFVPGVLVTLPPGKPANSPEVLALHGALFALLNHTVLMVLKTLLRAL